MLKMLIILLASILIFCSQGSGQEVLHIVTLDHDDSSYSVPVPSMGILLAQDKLNYVSNNVLNAEKWLRTNVLSYYPSSNTNTIIVANNRLCQNSNIQNLGHLVRVIVGSMKNIYHSLTRWGLEKDVKVSVLLSLDCVHYSYLKPVLAFLKEVNSTYTINPYRFDDQNVRLVKFELKKINDLGVFRPEKVHVVSVSAGFRPSRKLSFLDSLWSPEVVELSMAPAMAPASSPSPHYGFALPPCNPHYPHPYHAAVPPMVAHGGGPVAAPPVAVGNGVGPVVGGGGGPVAAPPVGMGGQGLWCVAKPSVPSEKLQEAMDYACGEGGADCGPIRPNGSCYVPDSVVAHASYAFNSYWQKNKKNGGVCGFEGTAMLISSDPSYLHCHFFLG